MKFVQKLTSKDGILLSLFSGNLLGLDIWGNRKETALRSNNVRWDDEIDVQGDLY